MKLGNFELTTVSGGRFRIDGGTMFGVVPKALWSRTMPADDNNTIPQATTCVLLRDGSRTALIDTGYGSKLPAKQRKILSAEDGAPLLSGLDSLDVAAEDVTDVILSHLHFDHAGGATTLDSSDNLIPTFPNATYHAQRLEWVNATAGYPELAGAYPQDNLLPLQDSGRLRLVDGDAEIIPGIRGVVTGGHTAGHMMLFIESGGETAAFLGDICPSRHHLPFQWVMGYDVDMLQSRRAKRMWLPRVAGHNWLAIFDHDPDCVAARLTLEDDRVVCTETMERV